MVETQDREAELKRKSTKQKKKLLDNLEEEETKMETEMTKFQKIRDNERKLLNEKMNQAEQQSDFLIKELMDANLRYSDPAKVMEALEADKKQMEEQFTIVNGDIEKLKEKEVLRKFFFFIYISKAKVFNCAQVLPNITNACRGLSLATNTFIASNHLQTEFMNYLS